MCDLGHISERYRFTDCPKYRIITSTKRNTVSALFNNLDTFSSLLGLPINILYVLAIEHIASQLDSTNLNYREKKL